MKTKHIQITIRPALVGYINAIMLVLWASKPACASPENLAGYDIVRGVPEAGQPDLIVMPNVLATTQNESTKIPYAQCGVTWVATQTEGPGGGTEIEKKKELDYRPFTISLEAGTTGPGVTVNWRFLNHFGLRAGFQYFGYSVDDIEVKGINYSADLRLMWTPVALDLYPWKSSSFRLTIGAFLNQNKLDGTATSTDPTKTIELGEHEYKLVDIGGLTLKAEQELISPFASIGGNVYLGRAKRWSLMGELGVIYTGSPDISLKPGYPGKVSPQDLAAEIKDIEDAASNFKFWPIIKFGICFSF